MVINSVIVSEWFGNVFHNENWAAEKWHSLMLLLLRGRLMVLSEDKEMSFLNKLLILAVLGWLFQVQSPVCMQLFSEEKAGHRTQYKTVLKWIKTIQYSSLLFCHVFFILMWDLKNNCILVENYFPLVELCEATTFFSVRNYNCIWNTLSTYQSATR